MLAAILLAGLALRVGYVTSLWHQPLLVRDPVAVDIGRTLARTGRMVYVNRVPRRATTLAAISSVGSGPQDYARRVPLYPAFVAVHVRYLKPAWWPRILRLSQSLIGVLTCLGVYLLARRLGGRLVGLVAAVLAAINPLFIYEAGQIGPQCLLTCWLTWAMVFIARRTSTYLKALAGGACLAGAALTSASVLLLMPVLLLVLLCGVSLARKSGTKAAAKKKNQANRVMAVIVIALAALAGLIPWGLRNARLTPLGGREDLAPDAREGIASVFHGFVLGDTSMGITLYDGHGPHATGAPLPKGNPARREAAGGQSERQFELEHLEKALRSIRRNPRRSLGLAAGKIQRMYSAIPNTEELSAPLYTALGLLWWLPLSAAAIGGVVLAIRRRWPVGLLLTVPIYLTGVHAIFVASISDRLGAEPVFIVLAALAIVRLFGGARRRKDSQADAA